MAKILSAKDYGFRKVVVVVLNPGEPHWVHENAAGGRDAAPAGHTGDTLEAEQRAVEACHECKNNWRTEEFIFEGRHLLKSVPKTWEDIASEVETALAGRVATSVEGTEQATLVGRML